MPEKFPTIKFYILNTSFHGFKFICESKRHWSERIFWTCCCILSWVCSVILILSALDNFWNNAISFVVETRYLDWDTQFPSVAVCEIDNPDRIAEFADEVYGDPHDFNFNEVVKELAYFKGLTFYTLQMCGPNATVKHADCAKTQFLGFSPKVRSPCSKIFKKCTWNQAEFNCCDHFEKMYTEVGMCFGVNFMNSKKTYPMISNKSTGPGSLILELNGITNVYLLGEQEVPTMSTPTSDFLQINPQVNARRLIAIREIENQAEVKTVSVQQRKCKFTYENNLEIYSHYSYSACCVDCRKKAQLQKCACVQHLMPNVKEEIVCDMVGLYCLNKNYNDLIVLKALWSNRPGLVCDCLPSCTEFEMSVLKDRKERIEGDHGVAEITLERLPTERYKRNVVRGRLDLVVSTGGIVALFLGASILSFVEVFYYFFIRTMSENKN